MRDFRAALKKKLKAEWGCLRRSCIPALFERVIGVTRIAKRKSRSFWLFVLPALLLYTALWILPLLFNAIISLTNWNGIARLSQVKFMALRNYTNAFSDPVFAKAMTHNLQFTTLNVLFIPTLAFLIAIAVEKSHIMGRDFFRTTLFIPAILPMLLVSILFRWVYSADGGILNELLALLHLEQWQRNFLGDYQVALGSLFAINVWKNVPFYMTIIISALQSVPHDQEEAIQIDGAGFWRSILHVVIPSIRPILQVVVSLVIIDGFRVFDLVFNTTKGGPAYATEVMGTLIYRVAFNDSRLGYATALSMINIVLVLTISVIYNRLIERQEA